MSFPKSFTCNGYESDPLPSGELIEFVVIGVSTWESPFSSVKNLIVAALNLEDILYMALYQSSSRTFDVCVIGSCHVFGGNNGFLKKRIEWDSILRLIQLLCSFFSI